MYANRLRRQYKTGIRSLGFLPVLLLFAFLAGSLSGASAMTPAGTTIQNSANLTYDGGSLSSNIASLTVAQVAGVSLTPTSASLSGAPTSTLYFPVTLTNNGNGTDTFSLSASSLRGWSAALIKDANNDGVHQEAEQTLVSATGNLPASGTFRFFVALALPAGAAANLQDTLTVSAVSALDTAASASTTFSARVIQIAGVSLTPATSSLSGEPSQMLYYPFAVTNTGNGADALALTLASGRGWNTQIVRDDNNDAVHQDSEQTTVSSTGSLTASGNFRFFAAVTIPAGTASGAQDTLTITATSSFDNTVLANATCSAQVSTSYGVGLTPTTAALTGAPGVNQYIGITITNRGANQDQFSLAVNCAQGWPVVVLADTNQDGVHQPTEITGLDSTGVLAAGASLRAFVEVRVPSTITQQTQANVGLFITSTSDSTVSIQGSYAVVAQVPVPGDVDGDGKITSTDINAAAQAAVGSGNWTPQQKACLDVNGDGVVNILDVLSLVKLSRTGTMQLQSTAVGGRQIALPIKTAAAGSRQTFDITLDDGTGVSGFQATLLFDGNLMNVADVLTGSLMGTPNWQIFYSVGAGEISLIAYQAQGGALASGSGSVLEIEADVNAAAQPGDMSALAWMEPLVSDASGNAFTPLDAVDGMITVAVSSAISVSVCKQQGGAPLASVGVEAWQGNQLISSGTTDVSGNCLLEGLTTGSYEIRANASGYYAETMTNVAVNLGETATLTIGLVPLANTNTGAIEGIVIDQNGNPVKGARVNFYKNGRRVAYTYTNATGYFCKTGLAPGSYIVTVGLKGYANGSQTVLVSSGQMSYADFILPLASNNTKRATYHLRF